MGLEEHDVVALVVIFVLLSPLIYVAVKDGHVKRIFGNKDSPPRS